MRDLLTSCLDNDQQVPAQWKLPKYGCDVLRKEKQDGKCPDVGPKDFDKTIQAIGVYVYI